MANRFQRNDGLIEISLIRTPLTLVTWSDTKIDSFYKNLISLKDSQSKVRAINDYHFLMKQRQKMIDRLGGKLPFKNKKGKNN